MIGFFRTFRQRLPAEYSVSRYLLHALGEIVLIVLGILIALYLDNINAGMQAREVEKELLKELRSNLESNIEILERTLMTETEYLAYNEMILEYLDSRRPYDEALDQAFGVYFLTVTTNPVMGGYEFLKSKGIDLISSDSLRRKISFIFDNEFSILKNENEVWSNNLQQNISYPYHVTTKACSTMRNSKASTRRSFPIASGTSTASATSSAKYRAWSCKSTPS